MSGIEIRQKTASEEQGVAGKGKRGGLLLH